MEEARYLFRYMWPFLDSFDRELSRVASRTRYNHGASGQQEGAEQRRGTSEDQADYLPVAVCPVLPTGGGELILDVRNWTQKNRKEVVASIREGMELVVLGTGQQRVENVHPDPKAIYYVHSHSRYLLWPGKGGPSIADSLAVKGVGRLTFHVSDDSLFFMYPVGGLTLGCAW